MLDLSDLITQETVLADVSAGNKRALFTALAAAGGRAWGVDPATISTGLAAREKLGTTGFGGGVALPHCKLAEVDRVCGVFARLTRPIDFAAVDELPVDLIFMLVSPLEAGADHLKALARVSRRMRDRNFAGKLRGAGSADALFALLAGVEGRDAA